MVIPVTHTMTSVNTQQLVEGIFTNLSATDIFVKFAEHTCGFTLSTVWGRFTRYLGVSDRSFVGTVQGRI